MKKLSTTVQRIDDLKGTTLEERAKLVLGTMARTQKEIRSAYRRLAARFHPDKKGGDEEAFQLINEAYQLLAEKVLPKRPLLADDVLLTKIIGRRVEPLIDLQKEWEEYERQRRERFYGIGAL